MCFVIPEEGGLTFGYGWFPVFGGFEILISFERANEINRAMPVLRYDYARVFVSE